MLSDIPGTSVHIGVIVASWSCFITYYVFARTSFGTRLDVLGANPRAAVHLGIDVPRLIVVAFLVSGALIGLAAVSRYPGYLRLSCALTGTPPTASRWCRSSSWRASMPSPLIPFAAFFGVLSIGGHYASRRADIPSDFVLLFVGLMLLFMIGTQYLSDKRARGESITPKALPRLARRG